MRRCIAPLVVALVGSLTSHAAAQSPSPAEKVQAEALFREGRALLTSGNADEACPKFAESERLDPQLGTALNLAICHDKQGHVATAWAELHELAERADAAGDRERAEYARQQADALEPRLPRLTVNAPSLPLDAVLMLDGAPLGRSVLTTALPVDPGEHSVTVSAKGKRPWKGTFTAAMSARATVDVPALEDDVAPPPQPAPRRDSAPPPSRVRPPVLAYAAFGVGVVGVGVGSVFGVIAANKKADSDEKCPGDVCTPEGHVLEGDARSAAIVSTVAFGVGLVGLAAGAVLWLTAKPSTPSQARLAIVPAARGSALRVRW